MSDNQPVITDAEFKLIPTPTHSLIPTEDDMAEMTKEYIKLWKESHPICILILAIIIFNFIISLISGIHFFIVIGLFSLLFIAYLIFGKGGNE